MKRITIISGIILTAVILLIDLSLFYQGSLEMYPSAEQIEKGRIVYGLLALPLIAVEAFLISKLKNH